MIVQKLPFLILSTLLVSLLSAGALLLPAEQALLRAQKNLSLLNIQNQLAQVGGGQPTIADIRGAGFVVVTDYAGVKNDGTGDSTAGIQKAIDDAITQERSVYFPAGTYIISDTLKAYTWQLWNTSSNKLNASTLNITPHVLIGASAGGNRPIIKLANSASKFDNAGAPRPMIAYRNFKAFDATGATPQDPVNPMGNPTNFESGDSTLFNAILFSIDFDTNKHPGAVGVHFPAAQRSDLADVKVTATGSYAGFVDLPGRNGGGVNIEVEGGQYGIKLEALAGVQVTGAKLYHQTVAPILPDDFVPFTMVGFHIIKDSGSAITMTTRTASSIGNVTLVDGVIEMGDGSLAIDNNTGKNLFLQNVYVRGTDNLIKTKGNSTVTGTGTWKRIVEYSSNDLRTGTSPYSVGVSAFKTYSLIDGVLSSTVSEPVKNIQSNASAAPSDIVTRHTWSDLPTIDDGSYVSVTSYGATPSDLINPKSGFTGNDDRAGIQAAIDAASAAGHGRVLLPRGYYYVGGPLTLHANTKLFGVGTQMSVIAVHDNWRPTTGEVVVMQTDNDANATTFAGFFTIEARTSGGGTGSNGADVYDRFGSLLWRAGKNSMTYDLGLTEEYKKIDTPRNPAKTLQITGSGGGKHYFVLGTDHSCNLDYRNIYISGTSQPLWLYGINVEGTKNCPGASLSATNIEVTNSSNVRLFSIKREGTSPSVVINNSQNVAVYSSGGMRAPLRAGQGGYIQITGSSNNILVANDIVQTVQSAPNGEANLREALTGKPVVQVVWPEGISVYKRGQIDDSAMAVSSSGSSPSSDGSTTGTGSGITAVLCSTYSNTTTPPQGYGAPYNLFTQAKELLLTALCNGNNTVTLTSGNSQSTTYIWNQAYYTRNGSTWNPITLTGPNTAGNGQWIIGTANTTVPLTTTEQQTQNYFASYVCTYQSNTWKCGCSDTTCAIPKWNLQGVKR